MIRGSELLTVFIPCLQNAKKIGLYQLANLIKLVGSEAAILAQCKRLQPELAHALLPLDMYVLGLIAIEAVEEDPIGSRDVFDCRHQAWRIPRMMFTSGLLREPSCLRMLSAKVQMVSSC